MISRQKLQTSSCCAWSRDRACVGLCSDSQVAHSQAKLFTKNEARGIDFLTCFDYYLTEGQEDHRMNCNYHPDRESVGTCTTCERQLCEDCKEVLDGRFYCYTCYSGAVQLAGETSDSGNLNWFERHLNWTMILAWLATSIPGGIGYAVSLATDSMGPVVVTGLIAGLAMLIVWGWALRKRNRSLLWLLLCLFIPPFGLLIFFYLDKKD